MLNLTISGNSLDLPVDFSLSLVYENPMLLTDRIPAPHSINFDLPATRRNVLLLKNPDRINSNTLFQEFENCAILFGPVVLLRGSLVVVRFEESIKLRFNGFIATDLLKKPLSDSAIEQINLGTGSKNPPLDTYFETVGTVGYNYKQLIESAVEGEENFAVAPVRILENWPGIDGTELPSESGQLATETLYFNFFNAIDQNFLFTKLGDITNHCACYPSPYLHYIIDKIFGNTLEDNIFSQAGLNQLVLFNYFHPAFLSIYQLSVNTTAGMVVDRANISGTNYQFWVELSRYSSFMLSNDILKEVFKIFCVTLLPLGNTYQLVFNKDIITANQVVNWDEKLIGNLAFEKQPGMAYRYGYESYEGTASSDGLITLDSIHDLHTASVDEEGAEFYIETTRQVIFKQLLEKYEAGDPDTFKYEVRSPGYGGAKNVTGTSFDMVSSIEPLPCSIHPYWSEDRGEFVPPGEIDPLDISKWYVPEFSGERFTQPSKPYLLFYRGTRPSLDVREYNGGILGRPPYPFFSDKNYDGHGTRLGGVSLEWSGPDGLLENYHTEFKAWVEKDKQAADGIFDLDIIELKNFDFKKKYNVRGKNFYVNRIEVTISLKKIAPARVILIEA